MLQNLSPAAVVIDTLRVKMKLKKKNAYIFVELPVICVRRLEMVR